jgi:hypothetical protein
MNAITLIGFTIALIYALICFHTLEAELKKHDALPRRRPKKTQNDHPSC